MPSPEIHDPSEVYLHLHTDAEVHLEPVTPEFWPQIGDRSDLQTGRLITGMATDSDWPTWEVHPAGDEVIILTAGVSRFHLDDGNDVTEHVVAAPRYLLMPKGVWHTMDVVEPGRAVVITWGEGTEMRPR